MNSYNIGLEDRKIIEEMYNAGAKPCEIAARIGKCQATIYREIKRGEVPELNARCRPAYRAEVAEKRVTEAYRKRGRRKGDRMKKEAHTMKKTENVYITHVLFPWETFAAQSEREARERASGGDRWTEDFLREVRENVLRYANEPFFPPDEFKHAGFMNTSMRNSCLNDVYRLVPLHFREEVFAGVSFPIWNQGARG